MSGIDDCWVDVYIGVWRRVGYDVFIFGDFCGCYGYDCVGDVVIVVIWDIVVCCCDWDCFLICDKVWNDFDFEIVYGVELSFGEMFYIGMCELNIVF